MGAYKNLLMLLPEVRNPGKKLNLKSRLLWTFGILILFLFLATIPIYGVSGDSLQFFERLELLLGAKIGKLLTLGIGPIVTASIILQLLKGSGIIKFDLTTEEGKFIFNGTQKLLVFIFILIEAYVFTKFGGVTPNSPDLFLIVVIQLILGGFIIVYMDEVVKKWGFGSGVSLFIAAGIGQALFLRFFSPFTETGSISFGFGEDTPVGAIWAAIYYLSAADINTFLTQILAPVLITVALFFLIVFFQSINVEIPLSFGVMRGQVYKWPLNFFYSGVIPVILISAFAANLQLWASFLNQDWLGKFDESQNIVGGFVYYLTAINIWDNLGNILTFDIISRIISYTLYLIIGCTLFSYLWVNTSGQDSKSVSKQIINSGLQIPGFRKDARIIQRVLDRYITPLTIMGGIGIGFLAASADILGALTSGTGILLMIMIIYQFYKQLARESMDDLSLLKRFMKK